MAKKASKPSMDRDEWLTAILQEYPRPKLRKHAGAWIARLFDLMQADPRLKEPWGNDKAETFRRNVYLHEQRQRERSNRK
jgi:hypothetical protein